MRPTPSSKYCSLVGPHPGLHGPRDLGHLRSAFMRCSMKHLTYFVVIPYAVGTVISLVCR